MSVSGFMSSLVTGRAQGPLALEQAIAAGGDALAALQKADGHWCFELEADATISAEYILLDHFLGYLPPERLALHAKLASYLRRIQEPHGGWPLYWGGAIDISASVKAYYALKCAGEDVKAGHMRAARQAILKAGGAEKSNVFTRIQLALFGAVPWRAVPTMPVEITLLPKWFPFHLSKVAYWSRTVIMPLLVVMALRPLAKNPGGVRVDELFVTPPEKVRRWNSNAAHSSLVPLFEAIDVVLRPIERLIPAPVRRKAIDKALAWITPRLNGQDGLGGIYPAMAYTAMMYHALGRAWDDPDYAMARKAVDLLIAENETYTHCQPCFSPVWDTGLAAHAAQEAGLDPLIARKACDWLAGRQILDVDGDYVAWAPGVRPGGWAFQYNNAYYPDVDDTAVVVMAMDRLDQGRYRENIDRAVEWIRGLQSDNGGWGAFDKNNVYYYLNAIPFADHGALLDPPTADVSARCLSMLGQLGFGQSDETVRRALAYLRAEQEPEGCWFGRWGTNYIYGTWSVLCALNAVEVDPQDPMIRRAVAWLLATQQADGGWGETCDSYYTERQIRGTGVPSTPSQTAWGMLALMAAGQGDTPALARAAEYLLSTQKSDGTWDENHFNAVGFPRVFYITYHGYKYHFPLWALARYKKLKEGNGARVMVGM